MAYYHLSPDHATILSGPHSVGDAAMKALTSCGNPEALGDAYLYERHIVPEWREAVEAPLGWQAPVLETRAGLDGVAVYAKGTPEERAAATLAARRAEMSCTPRQARLALAQSNLLDAVDAFVQAGDAALKIEWEYATEIRRDWPPVAAFAAASGMDEATIDGLFELAMTL
jgi:hypothetical protein